MVGIPNIPSDYVGNGVPLRTCVLHAEDHAEMLSTGQLTRTARSVHVFILTGLSAASRLARVSVHFRNEPPRKKKQFLMMTAGVSVCSEITVESSNYRGRCELRSSLFPIIRMMISMIGQCRPELTKDPGDFPFDPPVIMMPSIRTVNSLWSSSMAPPSSVMSTST